MPSIPKPEKRGPKPRQRIARVSAKGKRSRVSERRREQKRLAKLCNDRWAYIIKHRNGGPACESPRAHNCTRVWQAAHGFPKGAYPAVRYVLSNGFCLCSGEHTYFTHRELEWFAFLADLWGYDLFRSRLIEAKETRKHYLAEVAECLAEDGRALGLVVR